MTLSEKIQRMNEQIADCRRNNDLEAIPAIQRSLNKFIEQQDGEKKKPSPTGESGAKAAQKDLDTSASGTKYPNDNGQPLSKGYDNSIPLRSDRLSNPKPPVVKKSVEWEANIPFPVKLDNGENDTTAFRKSEKYHFVSVDYHPAFSRMNTGLRDSLKAWERERPNKDDSQKAARRLEIEMKTAAIVAYVERHGRIEFKALLLGRNRKLLELRYNFEIETTIKNFKLA